MKQLLIYALLLVSIAASAQTRKEFNPKHCDKCDTGTFLFKLFHLRYCALCTAEQEQEPDVQALDADTLHFYNEEDIRDWCQAHGLGTWTVEAPRFNKTTTIQEAVPYKLQTGCTLREAIGGTDSTFMAPDPAYWFKPDGCIQEDEWRDGTADPAYCIPNNQHWINEELYYGLAYCSMRDHLHIAKHEREMRPCFCDGGDLFGVVEYVTNPFTGQVAVFHDIYRWSNRHGWNMWNENLALYMVWPELANYTTVTFDLNTVHEAPDCDYTFRSYFPGHATMTLYFAGMRLIDGVPVTMTIAEAYGEQLGR